MKKNYFPKRETRKDLSQIMIHERDSVLSLRKRSNICVWIDLKFFCQNTVKMDSYVLDTRAYESTTLLYPRTGNKRWC